MSRTYCFTPIWNHTGQPAASMPAGFTDTGLPLGVQLIGRPNDEATLISLGAQIEAERPGQTRARRSHEGWARQRRAFLALSAPTSVRKAPGADLHCPHGHRAGGEAQGAPVA
jgi:Amidase